MKWAHSTTVDIMAEVTKTIKKAITEKKNESVLTRDQIKKKLNVVRAT